MVKEGEKGERERLHKWKLREKKIIK